MRQEALALIEAGHSVTVVCPATKGWEDDAVLEGVRVVRFGALPTGSGAVGYFREYATAAWRMWRAVRRATAAQRPDLVILANPPDFLFALVGGLRRRGARLIFDHHDLGPELFEAKFGRRGLLHRALVALERGSFRRADAVLSSNDSYARIARERGGVPPDRVFVVRNGPDPQRIHAVEPQPQLKRGREHMVLWLGHMSAQEGLGIVVEAAEHLRERDDVLFVLAGPGDARPQLEAEIERRSLGAMFDFPGELGDDEVRAYLSTADVCLSVDPRTAMNDLSSMIKVLEYMALGRAVVQFPLMEMQHICGDATLYAREGDARDLAEKIAELLDDPERRRRIGDAARARVEAGFAWPSQVPSLLAAVETALGAQSQR